MSSQPLMSVCARIVVRLRSGFTSLRGLRSESFFAPSLAVGMLAAHGCEGSLPGEPGSPLPGRINIEAFVATQVYVDSDTAGTVTGQFQIWFDVPADEMGPDDIASINIDGPDGLSYPINNEQLMGMKLSGWVRNDAEDEGYFWYQGVRLPLTTGRYTATVKFADGSSRVASRMVDADPALLDDYLAQRDELMYMPSGGAHSDADGTELVWTTLAGRSAFYTAWISPGDTSVIDSERARGGSMFRDASEDENAGLDATRISVGTSENPLQAGIQTWQVQITDSNLLSEIDMMIFSPPQHFTAD
jgi:hypothetical protein